MKYLFFILFTPLSQYTFSQLDKILVLDSLTHIPIPDVLLQSHNTTLYSNFFGEIELVNHSFDSISLIHSQYFSKFMKLDESKDTIFLQRKPQELLEITVQPKFESKLFDIGYYKFGKAFNNTGMLSHSATIAVFIPNGDYNIYIDEILLSIKSKQSVENYGVYLFKPDSLGLPDEIIYQEKILVDSLKKEGVINIHDLFIKVPENGIFIGIENFNIKRNKTITAGIRFDISKKRTTDKIFISLKDSEITNNSLWLPLNYEIKNYLYPRFGLKVYQK